eukprot:1346374-Alexandrium_andersonii.AAC.1
MLGRAQCEGNRHLGRTRETIVCDPVGVMACGAGDLGLESAAPKTQGPRGAGGPTARAPSVEGGGGSSGSQWDRGKQRNT